MLIFSTISIVFLSAFIQLALSPFTKVEESFNLHAIHDFLHQPSLSAVAHSGDHLQFPGPVPRTFIGALFIGAIARCLLPILRFLQLIHSKFGEQILVRSILATFNSSALVYFGLCTRCVFGDFVAILLLLISASQFHIPFYSSRTLPNMLAFPFVQIGLGLYILTMRRRSMRFNLTARKFRTLNACSFLTFAAVVFRLEIIGLLAPICLLSLLSRRVTFWQLVSRGFLATFAGLEMTLPIDSYFWQKLTWPEATSLIFNVVEGKSAQWGTMPWHFFFTSSLPKLLGVSYPLAILGFFLNRKIFLLGSCTIVFLIVMSCLSHKETRFIIYIVPIWNLSTAILVNRLSNFFSHSRWIKLGLISLILGSNLISTGFMTYLSMHNYPGGVAMISLHSPLAHLKQLPTSKQNLRVHLDDFVCQTGGSRFLQLNDQDGSRTYLPMTELAKERNRSIWEYDKLANLNHTLAEFDLIVSEKTHIDGFQVVSHIKAYDKIVKRQPSFLKQSQLFQKTADYLCSSPFPLCYLQSAWNLFSPIEILFNQNRVSIFINKKLQIQH